MSGSSRVRRRTMVIGALALAVPVAAFLGLVSLDPTPATPLLAQASAGGATTLAPSNPLDDTSLERWEIDVPEVPPPAPAKAPPKPAPRPDVNWNALALGVAEVSVGHEVGSAGPADIPDGLSPDQARAIIAKADEEAADKRGRLPSVVGAVVARGTPRGSGGGGRCD